MDYTPTTTALLRRPCAGDSAVDVLGIGVTESMATDDELLPIGELLGEISAFLD